MARIFAYILLIWLLDIHLHTASGVQQLTNPRIVEHPDDQFVAKNEPATLNCKAEGHPPPAITWYRNGKPVITANENPQSHRMLLPSGQLFFLRIIHNKNNKPDIGVYYCNATNPETLVSVVSRNATLDIAVIRDDFRQHPRNAEVAVGTTARLECKPPKGQPDPGVKWKKDGETIRLGGRVSIQREGDLVIHDAKESDSGIYVCIAHNTAGERESSPARLMVREKPQILEAPQDINVEEGLDVMFKCRAVGDPPPHIVWKREEGSIPASRSEILPDNSIKISKVRVSDEGLYICRAENSVGHSEALAKLTVLSEPKFLVRPRDKVVGVGRRVSFRCEVLGNPPPAVFWSRGTNNGLLFPRQDNGRFSVTDDGTLVIEPVRKDDGGEYVCQALSVAGSGITKATLQVKDVDPRPPPIIHQGPQNQTLPINTVAMLQCSASGDPPPTIRWYLNNRALPLRDPRLALLDSGTLQISDLRKSDTGMYTCKAMSETGETAWSAALFVEAPTDPSVVFHRTPEPSTFPGPPSKPLVYDITTTSMRLKWKANPNHGASPVYAFTVEYFSHETEEGWVVASDSITEQQYTVRHLRPGTSYMFLVRAQNSHGLSLPSQVCDPKRTGGTPSVLRPTVPQLDTQLVSEKLTGQVVHMKQPEVISSTAIKLAWKVVKAHSYIEGFHIKYRVQPEPEDYAGHRNHHHHVEFTIETVTSARATMYVLRSLKKYMWYEIRVQPFYLTVEGQESNTVMVRTFEDVPSAPPRDMSYKMVDNTTLKISWKPPPKEHHNGPLHGYVIFMYGNESKFNREQAVNNTVESVTVEHLVKGMNYRLVVWAFNRMGNGSRSDPLIIGGDSSGMVHGFVREPWFIATLIGTIGGTLWLALCVFSVWLYRKKKARKKYQKNGVMNVPVHKAEDTARPPMGVIATNQTPLMRQRQCTASPSSIHGNHMCMRQCCADELTYTEADLQRSRQGHAYPHGYYQKLEATAPDVTHVCEGKDDLCQENMYNVPSHQQPPMKTFYNKSAPPPAHAQPYATTTLINSHGGALSPQHSDSAFRPIQSGYIQQGGGSSDSCQKHDLSSESSNADNMRHDLHAPCPHCPPGYCDCANMSADEEGMELLGQPGPTLFLPPPPEHPPPSDIGTPPDSPTLGTPSGITPARYTIAASLQRPPSEGGGGHYGGHPGYYPPDPQEPAPPYNMIHNMAPHILGGSRTGDRPHPHLPKTHPHHQGNGYHGNDPQGQNWSPPSPKFRTMSPRTQQDCRAYSPRAMSEPERGPTPPIRGYKLVPIHDTGEGPPRHYSDTEGAPAPPLRMMGGTRSPPSPAPMDPMMDRGIQSSLPSLHGDNMHRLGAGDTEQGHRADSPLSEADAHIEYVGDSDGDGLRPDCGSPESSICDGDTVTGSMLASWASVTDNSDTNCSCNSSASSSDGSFLADADFASAVAKAAKLSGLTVVGSTITDPNVGRERVKKPAKQRQRAKRPTSPYSTDSNYSAVPVPHRPYPKSERKKQLQEHGSRRPAVKAKPPSHGDMYSKPCFLVTNGNTTPSRGGMRAANGNGAGTPLSGGATMSGGDTDQQMSVRSNPMAAFDTSDTPIV